MKKPMAFRQIHLDFHTSEEIANIGSRFDKEQFQKMLKIGHVDSITLFSKCHHGWAYHPSIANEIHPNLDFDLLQAQIDACHEIGVRTPVYISAGLDEKIAKRHHEWLIQGENKEYSWTENFDKAGYHVMCMNSPYLDYLIEQVKEVTTKYDADGIFLDIVGVRQCYCPYCMGILKERRFTVDDKEAFAQLGEDTYAKYTSSINEAIHAIKPEMRIFHNGGHIRCGRRDLATMNTHLELESLPTGGWGYQHFPMSARYVHNLGMNYLGMTGKFHTTWGEFGGYKHPNALRYEAALNIANGAKCSIGDQLHPYGDMDEATYTLIGAAYKEIEEKEVYCTNAKPITDIAFINAEAVAGEAEMRDDRSSFGCVKMMLEGHYLFDVVDLEVDYNKYKVIILPDTIKIDGVLKVKLDSFTANGGKILASGTSGLYMDKDEFAYDFGGKYCGESEFSPTYYYPKEDTKSLKKAPYVIYDKGYKIQGDDAKCAGHLQNPFFNRDVKHFCSHQHAPSTMVNESCGITYGEDGAYIAWNVFGVYNVLGSIYLKEMVLSTLDCLLGNSKTMTTSLPSQGINTLTQQESENRYVAHMLYANPILRGGFGDKTLEVIEDIIPLYNINIQLNLCETIKKAYLAPQMKDIEFVQNGNNVKVLLEKLECHQMIVFDY